LTTAYWDKRLEVYHSRRYGIWAFIVGRLIWLFVYDGAIMTAMLAVGLMVAGVKLSPDLPLVPALSFHLVFVLTSFGIGLIGASNFVFLEIKQGREPVTWLVDILVRIFSGVYYPLTVIPISLRWIAWCLPHTYVLRGIRLVMINGMGFGSRDTLSMFLVLLAFCTVALAAGIWLLNKGLHYAEATSGIAL